MGESNQGQGRETRLNTHVANISGSDDVWDEWGREGLMLLPGLEHKIQQQGKRDAHLTSLGTLACPVQPS